MVMTNAERQRRYRKRYPDRFKESKRKYRQTEKGKQTERRYYKKYKPKANENQKRYYKRNISNPKWVKKHRKQARATYHRNKHKYINRYRQRNKMNNIRLKEQCMNHYCNGDIHCPLCGVKDIDVLTIDHKYGGGNRLRNEFGERTGINLYRDLIKNNFPRGYRVLCFNCNHKESLRLKLRGKKVSDETIAKYRFNNKKERE